jgi:serine/threonine protein kinase
VQTLWSLKQGRYRVFRQVSRGIQKATFEAVESGATRRVAIKCLRVRGAAPEELEHAEREAQVLSAVWHPNIVRFVDFFEEGGYLNLVTVFEDGYPLAARGDLLAPSEPQAVVRLLGDLGAALAYLHQRPVPMVHRNVNPENVLRRWNGSYVLMGFGSVWGEPGADGRYTYPGRFGYLPPEFADASAMPASDIHGAGVTALAVLTGREPEDLPRTWRRINLRLALQGKDPRWVGIFEQLLADKPGVRPTRIQPLIEGFTPGASA